MKSKLNLIFGIFSTFLCSCNCKNHENREASEEIIKKSAVPSGVKRGVFENNAVWDISSMIFMNIDELIKFYKDSVNVQIDTISLNSNLSSDVKEFAFSKGKNTLYVTIDKKDRGIKYFFIDAIESENFGADGATSDFSDLMKIGALELESKKYKVEPIQSVKVKNRYLGIKIIPYKLHP